MGDVESSPVEGDTNKLPPPPPGAMEINLNSSDSVSKLNSHPTPIINSVKKSQIKSTRSKSAGQSSFEIKIQDSGGGSCISGGNSKTMKIEREHLELTEALRDLSASFAVVKGGAPSSPPHEDAVEVKAQSVLSEEVSPYTTSLIDQGEEVGGDGDGGGGEDAESVLELELGMMMGVPPRTIPFRSASFSQVDITSEGKYIRNPRSPITLKPTAFCYLNTAYNNAYTLPRRNTPTNQQQTRHHHPPPPHNQLVELVQAESPHHPHSNDDSQEPQLPPGLTTEEEATANNSETANNAILSSSFINNLQGTEENEQTPSPFSQSTTLDYQNSESENICEKSAKLVLDTPLVQIPNLQNATLVPSVNLFDDNSNNEPLKILNLLPDAIKMSASGGRRRRNKVVFEVGDPDYVDPAMDTLHSPKMETQNVRKDLALEEGDKSDPPIENNFQVNLEIDPNSVKVDQERTDENVQVDSEIDREPEHKNENNERRCGESLIQQLNSSTSRVPPIIRRESLTSGLLGSSSEDSPQDDLRPPTTSEKAKKAFKMGLHAKLPLLDLDSCGGGGGSSISGGEDDEKFSLNRQSSGQSDGSDELLPPGVSDGGQGQHSDPGISTSPPTIRNSNLLSKLNPHTTPLAAALALDSSLNNKNIPLSKCKDSASFSGTKVSPIVSSSSAPTSFASSPPTASYTSPGSPTSTLSSSDFSRTNSVSSPSGNQSGSGGRQLPPRRYYKRPLRGPYGEMLEAEMNKVISSRKTRELDNLEFFRESKSSSPNRSPPSDRGTLNSGLSGSPKLVNSLLMASMDDLNLTTSNKQSKHPNPRCRKTSTNIPVSPPSHHYHSTGPEGGVLTYHQRTASSPSQLLYSSSCVEPRSSRAESSTQQPNLDASPRGHVLAELVETEKSYVDSLRILVKKYMEPLKMSDYIDTGLVDEIFFQIPAILWHHERILDALQRRVIDDTQCIGDVLLDTFRQNSLLECYSLFVNNWKNAKGSLKMAVASKPQLARFLETNSRQHKGKLSVDSLLIMPIQRIPRYELLVKELLKHTELTHEDHSRLMLVLEKIKKFAVHIDCASVDPNDNREIEIEGWTAGLGHLVRQDVVTLCTSANVRKERALFLFADSIVIASIKRKNTMRKTSSNQFQTPGANIDGCKFKLLMKVPLTDVYILNDEHDHCPTGSKAGSHGGASHSEDLDDLKTIHKMMDLATLLKCNHAGLDDLLKELASGLKHHCDNSADAVEFEIKSGENSESPDVLKILFGANEKKTAWLDSFQNTLGKFIRYGFGRMPQMQFLQALPIRKTRAGLLLSCAAPVSLQNKLTKSVEMSDVWVANSDGYVGQICILTLHPEPAITSCNGVCNSRITCILSVPPSSAHVSLGISSSHPHSDDSSSFHHHHPHHHQHHSLGYESEDESHKNRSGHKGSTEHWSVWLGTEDGALHVYDCSDSVRVKKNRHKVQHKAPLNCMVYYDCRVFVSLGNGDVAVYCRNPHGKGWLVNEPSWVTIGSGINPVTRMLTVGSNIWCVCGSQIKVYGESGGMLELLQAIQISGDGCSQLPRGISNLIATDDTVWIAVQGSSILKSYSTTSFECLFETDVAPEVSKILTGCDDIIRQHKSACLRVTALLVAPDRTLWIGTSAGVILILTSSGPNHKITPLSHGHTGQVRFLTFCTTRDSCVIISGGDGYEEFRPLTPILNNNNNSGSASFSSVVCSLIGDTSVDLSGREDSTNHLLIWRVPKMFSN